MFAWIKDFRESTNAGLTPGMMSAVFALKTVFQAARFYPAFTGCIKNVRLK